MADDVSVTAGSYSATVAADDIGGVHYQRAKVTWGPDGTANDADVATGKPLPIQLRSDVGAVLGLVSDAASSGGETGILPLAIRKDSAAAIADTDGDFSPLQLDANGFLRITLGTALSSAIDSVTAVLGAATTLIGDVGIQGRATGGLSTSSLISLASTNAALVKSSAGTVYSVQVFNQNAAVRYLKLYDKATAPTVGTDVPVKRWAIPGASAGAGIVWTVAQGLAFTSGIGFALTANSADSDTSAVGAGETVVNLDYR